MKNRKRITMTVTVSVPHCMTARQARREVRYLVNCQSNYMSHMSLPDGEIQYVDEETVRAVKVCAK